jgi:PKD repeat protein
MPRNEQKCETSRPWLAASAQSVRLHSNAFYPLLGCISHIVIASVGIGLAILTSLSFAVAQKAPNMVAFTASPISGIAPLTVTFTNVGTYIDYGDGSLGPIRSEGAKVGEAKHTYKSAGTYTAHSDGATATITVLGSAKP